MLRIAVVTVIAFLFMGAAQVGQVVRRVQSGVVSNTTEVIPAGYAIRDIFIRNTTANAITGGIKIGTTDGAIDVVIALAVGANAFTLSVPLIRQFSATVDQTLFIQTVTAWNSASINYVITLDRAIP